MKLSIVIPCYNEQNNIPLILARFAGAITREDIEVILVNNGSTDDSAQILRTLVPRYPFARTVLVPVNLGYGFGIISGLKEATGEYIGWTHADLQTDPQDTVRALDIIETSGNPTNIYVKGKRTGRAWFDNLFTIGMSFFETLYLHKWLWDINAQPNIFHRRLYEQWGEPPHDFALDLFALYMARQYRFELIRFEVIFPERIHGQSSWNTGLKAKWKFIKRTIGFSARLKQDMKKWNSSPIA
ncbi:MAG: glycosyltransferase [Deltaproteobacteria bacterium]|nr:glycosyltransferase [Deltaproteobacteria bacterium]MBF0524708.1 glycosyltransferase [Deltaproteobacteria bacterium]